MLLFAEPINTVHKLPPNICILYFKITPENMVKARQYNSKFNIFSLSIKLLLFKNIIKIFICNLYVSIYDKYSDNIFLLKIKNLKTITAKN